MSSSRWLGHRALVCLTAIAFAFCMTACERTVTKYDETGKPYSEKEFDPWMTIGGFILFGIILGGVIYAAEVNSSGLLDEGNSLLAYAPSGNTASDALPLLSGKARWIEVLDPQGNLLSRHLIRTDRLGRAEELVNPAEIQLSSEINEQVLKHLVGELAQLHGAGSVPKTLKARLAVLDAGEARLQIKSVEVSKDSVTASGPARLFMSPAGIFRVTGTADSLTNEIEVTLSQLN